MADNAMVQGASKHGRPLLVLAGHTVVLGQDLVTCGFTKQGNNTSLDRVICHCILWGYTLSS